MINNFRLSMITYTFIFIIAKINNNYLFGIDSSLYLKMSANRLKNTKKKFEDILKKDLTPKNSKPSPKISPVYSSFRGGLTIKPDLIPKTKIVRPSTSKFSNDNSQNFFHSR